jgi:hypothetical protein
MRTILTRTHIHTHTHSDTHTHTHTHTHTLVAFFLLAQFNFIFKYNVLQSSECPGPPLNYITHMPQHQYICPPLLLNLHVVVNYLHVRFHVWLSPHLAGLLVVYPVPQGPSFRDCPRSVPQQLSFGNCSGSVP